MDEAVYPCRHQLIAEEELLDFFRHKPTALSNEALRVRETDFGLFEGKSAAELADVPKYKTWGSPPFAGEPSPAARNRPTIFTAITWKTALLCRYADGSIDGKNIRKLL